MNFLYWNINRKSLVAQVAAIVKDHDIDLIMLSENGVKVESLRNKLFDETGSAYSLVYHGTFDPLTLTRLPNESFMPKLDSAHMIAFLFRHPRRIGVDFNLFIVHLRSKLHSGRESQQFAAVDPSRDIFEVERQVGHRRSIIIGDFNMNPFEEGLTASHGFHAVMSKDVAQKNSRVVQGREHFFFYNPMWSFFGDIPKGPPGTYFYDNSDHVNYFWNMFDQVLVRPELMNLFPDDKLKIVTQADGQSLLNARGRPDGKLASDHLPVVFSLDFEKGVINDTGESMG